MKEKKFYNVDYMNGMKVIVDGQVINSDKTMFDWLNSFYYHIDGSKRETFSKIYSAFPEPVTRVILIDMFLGKTGPIFEVGNIVAFLLGIQKEYKFNL